MATTYGTSEVADPVNSGASTLSGTSGGAKVSGVKGGAKAGVHLPDPKYVEVSVSLPKVTGEDVVFTMVVAKADLVTGKPLELRGYLHGGLGTATVWDPVSKSAKLVAALWSGTLTLSQVGTNKGDPVVGSFTSSWITWPPF